MLKLIPGNAQHIGARKEQQDSFGFSDTRDTALLAHGGLLAVVADGMGGLEGGQQAGNIAVHAFLAAYARKTPPEPIPAALHRALLEANHAVLALARRSGTEGNTGTTFAAAALHHDLLYWVAVGDSRIYLLRDGNLVQVNADHTYGTTLWSAVAAGRLDRDSARNDPQAPHLTSHLGMDELAQIDLSERAYPLLADDVVVICSDGVYRALGEPEMAEAFHVAASPAAACEAVKAAVLAKASPRQDNLTLLAIQCRDPRQPPTRTPAPAQLPPRNPSNLGLVSLIGVELLMAVGLVAWNPRSQSPTVPQAAPTSGSQGTQPKTPLSKQQPANSQLETPPAKDLGSSQPPSRDPAEAPASTVIPTIPQGDPTRPTTTAPQPVFPGDVPLDGATPPQPGSSGNNATPPVQRVPTNPVPTQDAPKSPTPVKPDHRNAASPTSRGRP